MKVAVRLPCNHLFCSYCIRLWLRKNSTCPLCKSQCHIHQIQPDYEVQAKLLHIQLNPFVIASLLLVTNKLNNHREKIQHMKKLSIRNYASMTLKSLRKEVDEFHLNIKGNKEELSKYHYLYCLRYNEQCDALVPMPQEDIINEINELYEINKFKKMKKPTKNENDAKRQNHLCKLLINRLKTIK